MIRSVIFVFILITFQGIGWCEATVSSKSAEQFEEHGAISNKLVWKYGGQILNEIPVCWEDLSQSTNKDRLYVKRLIEKEWESNSEANVAFIGWKECPSGPSLRVGTGARIKVVDDANDGPRVDYNFSLVRGGESDFNGLDGVKNGVVLNFELENWYGLKLEDFDSEQLYEQERKRIIGILALHEFGHVLGLEHEHQRPDVQEVCVVALKCRNTNENQQCVPQDEDQLKTFKEGGKFKFQILTSYDPNSIMNYCGLYERAAVLTELDKLSVRKVYGVKRK